MRILVTGGAGFLGSHLVDQLLDQQHAVVIVDNFVTGRFNNLRHLEGHPHLTIVHQDLTKPITADELSVSFDRVYNLASPASPKGYGRYPIETQMVNSIGTMQVLDIARRDGARFLQASTSEVYGDPLVHPQTEDYWGNVNPVGPRACYDEGKRFAESLIMEYVRQHGVDARLARIFNTYGPRSHPADGRVVPAFCMQAIRGEPLTIYGDGMQTRSFCYVSDLVRGFLLLMETGGLQGEIVNLGNPSEITVHTFAEIVLEVSGSQSKIVFEPLPKDDPTRRQPDISKAKQLLGWTSAIELRDGLEPTIEYFKAFA